MGLAGLIDYVRARFADPHDGEIDLGIHMGILTRMRLAKGISGAVDIPKTSLKSADVSRAAITSPRPRIDSVANRRREIQKRSIWPLTISLFRAIAIIIDLY